MKEGIYGDTGKRPPALLSWRKCIEKLPGDYIYVEDRRTLLYVTTELTLNLEDYGEILSYFMNVTGPGVLNFENGLYLLTEIPYNDYEILSKSTYIGISEIIKSGIRPKQQNPFIDLGFNFTIRPFPYTAKFLGLRTKTRNPTLLAYSIHPYYKNLSSVTFF